MIEVYKNLFVGTDDDCCSSENIAIIHACKTCHQKVLGYGKALPQDHANYLTYNHNNDNLYLNLVDMKPEFSPIFTDPIMKEAVTFINKNILEKPILVHCNQGVSRSPSIALLYLSLNKIIDYSSYAAASLEFIKLYPDYNPGSGIFLYLSKHWNRLLSEYLNTN